MKRITALSLILSMLCSFGITALAHPFTDITKHWAESQLEIAYSSGMINGDPDGRFRPDDNISRCEYLKMLTAVTAQWFDTPQAEMDRFANGEHWAYKFYNYALYQGWVVNYTSSLADPEFEEFVNSIMVGDIIPGNMDTETFDLPIERWEMAYLASRFAHSICGASISKKAQTGFADYSSIAASYPELVTSHISCSFGAGIMTGDEKGNLNASNNGTRAEAAVMVNRYLALIEREYKAIPQTNKTYTDIPQGHPVAVITLNNQKTIELELYPEYAPQTVAHFVELVKSGYYNQETDVSGVNKTSFPGVGSLCTFSSPAVTETTVYGEFAKNGYMQNTLPFTKGTVVLDHMWSYNDGKANFRILCEDMPQKTGSSAAFGKVISGIDVVESLCEEGGTATVTSIVIK